MAIRNIVSDINELRRKTREYEKFDERLHTLLDDMAQTMYEANGVGLAAPQVGVFRKCVVLDDGNGLIELINPEITKKEGKQEDIEGCLSFAGEYGIVQRPEKITVTAKDRNGKSIKINAEGFLARIMCHEIDHLNGIVFKDLAKRMLSQQEVNQMSQKEPKEQD